VCGSAHAQPKLKLTLDFIPLQFQAPQPAIAELDQVLARYQLRAPDLKPTPFNARLRTVEYEDHRRAQRVLAKSDMGQRSEGAQSGLLEGDLASVAQTAATCLSFNLTLRPGRKAPRFFLEPDRSRAPWAVGLGLGRVGLGLRTEF
jgi:hypothetical protein